MQESKKSNEQSNEQSDENKINDAIMKLMDNISNIKYQKNTDKLTINEKLDVMYTCCNNKDFFELNKDITRGQIINFTFGGVQFNYHPFLYKTELSTLRKTDDFTYEVQLGKEYNTGKYITTYDTGIDLNSLPNMQFELNAYSDFTEKYGMHLVNTGVVKDRLYLKFVKLSNEKQNINPQEYAALLSIKPKIFSYDIKI